MQDEQQPVLGGRQPEQPGADERPVFEIEGSLGLGLGASLRLGGARLRRAILQILDRQCHLQLRRDHLHRLPVLRREARAQHLVPAHQRVQRGAQRCRIELARKLQQMRDVVGRARGHQPIEQPQPLLRKRQRRRLFGLVNAFARVVHLGAGVRQSSCTFA